LDNRKYDILAQGNLANTKSDFEEDGEDYEDDYYLDLPYGYGTDQVMVYIIVLRK
jgi:hypothetical protein